MHSEPAAETTSFFLTQLPNAPSHCYFALAHCVVTHNALSLGYLQRASALLYQHAVTLLQRALSGHHYGIHMQFFIYWFATLTAKPVLGPSTMIRYHTVRNQNGLSPLTPVVYYRYPIEGISQRRVQDRRTGCPRFEKNYGFVFVNFD